MAGFEFVHAVAPDERELTSRLLRRGQQLARNLDLVLRYHGARGSWHVTVDGPLPSMQALILPLSTDWRPFAEGSARPPRLARRRLIAQSLLDAYLDGLGGMRESVEEIAELLGGTAASYFINVGSSTHLVAQCRNLTHALIRFHNSQVPASSLVEELHTSVEALSRALIPKSERSGTFAAVFARAASSAGLTEAQKATVLQLKDKRRGAKHRGQQVSAQWLNRNLRDTLDAIQLLAKAIRGGS